jgi:hypothetical protein
MFVELASSCSFPARVSRGGFAPAIHHRFSALCVFLVLAAVLCCGASGCDSTSARKQAPSSPPHKVTLSWTASVSKDVGYRVYRATRSGGPYTIIQFTPITGTSFVDSNVQAGQTYFYVVTAIDRSGVESAYSKEISATVPSP